MEESTAIAGIPASRQKNCNSCVQAKRRCDRRTPICFRCAEKKIPCVYTKTKSITRSVQHDAETFSYVERPSIISKDSQPDPAAAAAENTHNHLMMDADSNSDIPMDPFMSLMGNDSTSARDQWLASMDQGSITEHSGSPADEEIVTAYQKMSCFCEHIDPWHLYDPQTPLHYTVARIKGFTTDVTTRNATPFLHRYLYRDHAPQCILSCFTVNVLYTNRTEANTPMVMRVLHNSVRQLVDTEVGRVVATPVEKLARAQTLFLYQIIRLIDGDVILRAQGEKDMPLLQTWLGDLCRMRGHLGDLAEFKNGVMRKQPPEIEWERWIFAESVRRTIVMAYSVITLYEIMKDSGSTDDLGPWAYVHRWTLSRHLWEANSSFKFDRMWKEKPHYIINNYSFEKFLEHGRGEDVDEFAEILLSVYMGVDETKEFIPGNEAEL